MCTNKMSVEKLSTDFMCTNKMKDISTNNIVGTNKKMEIGTNKQRQDVGTNNKMMDDSVGTNNKCDTDEADEAGVGTNNIIELERKSGTNNNIIKLGLCVGVGTNNVTEMEKGTNKMMEMGTKYFPIFDKMMTSSPRGWIQRKTSLL